MYSISVEYYIIENMISMLFGMMRVSLICY